MLLLSCVPDEQGGQSNADELLNRVLVLLLFSDPLHHVAAQHRVSDDRMMVRMLCGVGEVNRHGPSRVSIRLMLRLHEVLVFAAHRCAAFQNEVYLCEVLQGKNYVQVSILDPLL